jgi:hypothetical protein
VKFSPTRFALAAIVIVFFCAEIARPTTFATKRSAHVRAAGSGASYLDQAELDDLPPIVMPALGNIDDASVVADGRARAFEGDAELGPDAELRIVGWCADPQTHEPGAELIAIVDRTRRIDFTTGYRIARPDVAKYYAAPAMRATGFTLALPAREIGAGRHEIAIAVVTADGGSIATLPTIVHVRIR